MFPDDAGGHAGLRLALDDFPANNSHPVLGQPRGFTAQQPKDDNFVHFCTDVTVATVGKSLCRWGFYGTPQVPSPPPPASPPQRAISFSSALQRTNTKNLKQIVEEKELRGHRTNFHIHVSVSDLYILTMDLPIL